MKLNLIRKVQVLTVTVLLFPVSALAQDDDPDNDTICSRSFYGETVEFMSRKKCRDSGGDVAGRSVCLANRLKAGPGGANQQPIEAPQEVGQSIEPLEPFAGQFCVVDVENKIREGRLGYRLLERIASGDGEDASTSEEGATARFHVDLRQDSPAPPDNIQPTGFTVVTSHLQSIVRVPGNGENGWLVFGRQRGSLGAAFYVAELGNAGSEHQGEWFIPYTDRETYDEDYYDQFRSNPGGLDRVRAYKEIATTKHIGGMQALGNLVAIGVQCDGACRSGEVQFWHFGSPTRPRLVHILNLSNGNKSDLGSEEFNKHAHWVALTYLRDGRLMAMVSRGNNEPVDVFVADDAHLHETTEWTKFSFDPNSPKWIPGGGTYQNVSLLRSCPEDGRSERLYLAGFRQRTGGVLHGTNPWKGDNQIQLFRFDDPGIFDSPDNFSLSHVSDAQFERFGDFCQMRGGASIYVSPSGDPIVYCAEGESKDGRLKVSEITALP